MKKNALLTLCSLTLLSLALYAPSALGEDVQQQNKTTTTDHDEDEQLGDGEHVRPGHRS